MINKILTVNFKLHQKDLIHFSVNEQNEEVQDILMSPAGVQMPIRESIPCGFKIKAVRVGFYSIQTMVSCGDNEGKFTLLCHACNAIFKQVSECKGNNEKTDDPVRNNECSDGGCIDKVKKFITSHPYISIAAAISVVGLPFVCALLSYASTDSRTPKLTRSRRIINGIDINNLCFIARIDNIFTGGCGGTIVSGNQIITAAHCIEPKYVNNHIFRVYSVSVGHSSVSSMKSICRFKVKSIAVNSKVIGKYYEDGSGDIAVVTIFGQFLTAGCNVCRIDLITPQEHRKMQSEELTHTLSSKVKPNLAVYGWGKTSHAKFTDRLQGTALRNYRVNKRQCTQNKICAGYYDPQSKTDSCQGDSGGPLVFFSATKKRGVLAGVVSADGIIQTRCADGHLSEYTDIDFNRSWLKSKLKIGGRIKRYNGNPLNFFKSKRTTTPAPTSTTPATTTAEPTTSTAAPTTTTAAPTTTTAEPTTTTAEPTTLALTPMTSEPSTTQAPLDIKPILIFGSGVLFGSAVASSILLATKYRSNALCFKKEDVESIPSTDEEEEIEMETFLKFV